MSSATKGTERELFVSGFLGQVFPTHYRFSSGDITSHLGERSGQLDIVLEFPTGFSFPFYPEGPRLYLAEGVAAAIEVKSDLVGQWDEVLATGAKLRKIERRFDPDYYEQMAVEIESGQYGEVENSAKLIRDLRSRGVGIPNRAPRHILLFAVGFKGWKSREKLEEKLRAGVVDGIFVIESRLFSVPPRGFASGGYSMVMFLEALEKALLQTTRPLPVLQNYRI